MMWPPENNERISLDEVRLPLARATIQYLEAKCGDFIKLSHTWRLTEEPLCGEIVSFKVRIDIPQRPVYALRAEEEVAVCFWSSPRLAPLVFVLRDDFPDTPHQILVPDGWPAAICLDDRPWQDVRSTYTAAELVSRVFGWFNKACEGELHGADQPFDPVFIFDGFRQIIVSPGGHQAIQREEQVQVWKLDAAAEFLLITQSEPNQNLRPVKALPITLSVPADQMKRIRAAPNDLAGLIELFRERGADLQVKLKSEILQWLSQESATHDDPWIICILAEVPQIHPRTGEVGASHPLGFICPVNPGVVGRALGFLSSNDVETGAGVSYVRLLSETAPVKADLAAIPVQYAPVHFELDSARASLLSGASDSDQRKMLMIGAGSLGASIAEMLVREGLFRWTIIDNDKLLPHNLARHTLTRDEIGFGKARKVVERISSIREDAADKSISLDVLEGGQREEIDNALRDTDLILDASASVPVSRWLSDHPATAPRMCAFFTPDGRSAVFMKESEDRSVKLRDLELAYLREAMVSTDLSNHLGGSEFVRYTGACRALTSTIPASSVAILTALISRDISSSKSDPEPILKIWNVQADGAVGLIRPKVACVHQCISGWKVSYPITLVEDLRQRRLQGLPNETGGVLLGNIDHDARSIGLAHALPAPTDSAEGPSEFIRGTRGLSREIRQAEKRSGGQLRYLGEWHSHPPGRPPTPSATDLEQIIQVAQWASLDNQPAVSVIVGCNGLGVLVGKVE